MTLPPCQGVVRGDGTPAPRPGTGSRGAPQITPRTPPWQGGERRGAPEIPKARGHDPGQRLPARTPSQRGFGNLSGLGRPNPCLL